jgi:hypothetical protein
MEMEEQQGEVITIRGDEEDYYSQEGDEDDDAWHRARRRGSDDDDSGDSAPAPRSGTNPISTESEHNQHADQKPTGGQGAITFTHFHLLFANI